MISNCSQRPCGRKIAGWHLALSQLPLSPGLGPRGSRAEKLRQGWQGVTLVEDSRRDTGERAAERMHPSRPRGSSPPPLAQPGDTQLPCPSSEGQIPPHQRSSPGPLNGSLASEEAAGLGKQKNNAPGKNKARGILEKIHPEKPSLPQPIFFSPI